MGRVLVVEVWSESTDPRESVHHGKYPKKKFRGRRLLLEIGGLRIGNGENALEFNESARSAGLCGGCRIVKTRTVLLASDAGSYMTGNTMHTNRGLFAG